MTSPEWLGIDKDRLAFSVFAGNEDCPRDEEAANLWREMGVKDDQDVYKRQHPNFRTNGKRAMERAEKSL